VNPYYYDGCITLYCAKAEEVAPRLQDGFFGVLVLDPPYTIRLDNLGDTVARFRTKCCAHSETSALWVIVPALINMPTIEEHGHPHARPVEHMVAELVKTTGIILDPYAGVGSTLVAAKVLGREVVGIEMDPTRCAKIVERLLAA
jgi:hypothetical protein